MYFVGPRIEQLPQNVHETLPYHHLEKPTETETWDIYTDFE